MPSATSTQLFPLPRHSRAAQVCIHVQPGDVSVAVNVVVRVKVLLAMSLKLLLIVYIVCCCVDSLIVRNVKKKVLYSRAKRCASRKGKELVVLGSPHLDLRTGGVISYITEKTIGPTYGCGDVCVDIAGCSTCCRSYTCDILDYLKTKRPKSCVLFSSGVLEFTQSFPDIKKEIERTCVANYTDYYSPWNITWYSYGCAANNKCGLLKGLPERVFWRNPFGASMLDE